MKNIACCLFTLFAVLQVIEEGFALEAFEAYDFENIESTEVFSLLHSEVCENNELETEEVTKGAILYYSKDISFNHYENYFKSDYDYSGNCEMRLVTEFREYNKGKALKVFDAVYLSGLLVQKSQRNKFLIEVEKNTKVLACGNTSLIAHSTSYSYAGIYFLNDSIPETDKAIDRAYYFSQDVVPEFVERAKLDIIQINAAVERQRMFNLMEFEICKLRQATMNGFVSLASNMNMAKMFLGTGSMLGIHAEKTGGVLTVHKCAKIDVMMARFDKCVQEVPVFVFGQEGVKFMDPVTRVVYPNYTLIPCAAQRYLIRPFNDNLWMYYGKFTPFAPTPEQFSAFTTTDFRTKLELFQER